MATTELDSPWKDILEQYFEEFMHFFFPEVHALIDWKRGYEFLDKEFQQVVRDA
ncbi:MAG: cytosolic protein, partial [Gammaproteobacteria bacterium]|nr:cytosolic protein [Gammaproteobacteria bacterium]